MKNKKTKIIIVVLFIILIGFLGFQFTIDNNGNYTRIISINDTTFFVTTNYGGMYYYFDSSSKGQGYISYLTTEFTQLNVIAQKKYLKALEHLKDIKAVP